MGYREKYYALIDELRKEILDFYDDRLISVVIFGSVASERNYRTMRNIDLAKDYLKKAITRLEVLEIFFKKEDYSDVIREAQEAVIIVETAKKIINS